MESTTLIYIVIIIALGGAVAYLFTKLKKDTPTRPIKTANIGGVDAGSLNSQQLQLQAYERLTLLAGRIALPGLIARVSNPALSARDMQMILTQTIRQEFDYNITQQIYVSADAWNAIKSLMEQNILIVHQIATALPPEATGNDLCKILLEYLMNDPKGTMHEVVCEVLSYEAKTIL